MRRVLRIAGIIAGMLVVLAACLALYVQLGWDRKDGRQAPILVAPRDPASVARGEYIFMNTWQCWGCHSGSDGSQSVPPAGGRAFDLSTTGPGFGMYYAKNITPDSATGIGAWTDGEIVQAIREGVRRDRHLLFPLMPVDWLHRMSDEDALAIVAYLRSLPPVRNDVPPATPSFVARALFAFGVLSALPPVNTRIAAPAQASTREYGEYVATALSGCADCHTPRDLKNGKFFLDSLFAGGTIAFGEPEGEPIVSFASNLREILGPGPGRWSEDQFVTAVTGGMRPDSSVISPHMPYARYKFVSPDDLHALFVYFTSLPRIDRGVPAARYTDRVNAAHGTERGAYVFAARCQACHGRNGTGTPSTSVRLADVAGSLADSDMRDFIGAGQPDLKMPSFAKTLGSDDIANVIAYIRSWNQTGERTTTH